MHMSDFASSLNSDQGYCVLGLNQRAYRFSLARRVVTKKMILSPFQIGTVSGSGTGPLDYRATGPVPDPEPRL